MGVPGRRLPLTLWLAAALMLGPAPQATATRVNLESVAFVGTVSLPVFPCPLILPGELPCEGSIEGSVAGTLSGVNQGSLWEVSFNTALVASFVYADLIKPGIPCSEGLASGSFALDTQQPGGQAFGTYHVPVLPRAVRNVIVTGGFDWRRAGVTALMDIRDLMIQLQVEQLGWITVVEGGDAISAASFVPHVDPAHPPGCFPEVDPQEIEGSVTGEITGIGASTDP